MLKRQTELWTGDYKTNFYKYHSDLRFTLCEALEVVLYLQRAFMYRQFPQSIV